jgi:hypothetical protein
MRSISVLFTNNTLARRAGSEVYVRDVALALQRRGHRPMAFSLVLGDVAAELRRATIPVVDDVSRIGEVPDVIHGHHHVETLIAALAFPNTPIVNFCHGWVPWEELPVLHPSVRRYVAVDEVCVDRLMCEEGISRDRIDLLLNFVDLQRFRPRPALPAVPRRALVLSNSATTDGYARVIADACASAGIALDVVGTGAGNATRTPEELLGHYDLVFAKGRTALESLATGCATILADWAGAGPLVTRENYERLRLRNFGIREIRHSHEASWYREQIAQYDATETAGLSARVRAEAGMEPAIDRLLAIYSAAVSAPVGPGDAGSAAARHLARIAQPLKDAHDVSVRLHTVTADLERTRGALQSSEAQLQKAGASLASLEEQSQTLQNANKALADEVRAHQSVAIVRLRNAVLNVPLVGPAMHALVRWFAQLSDSQRS